MARASSREEHFDFCQWQGVKCAQSWVFRFVLQVPAFESPSPLSSALVGGVPPYFLKWNEAFLVLGMQFAGGVFLGTALMHFLSDANEMIGNLTEKDYPFALMLACASYFLTMLAACALFYV